MAHYGKGLSCLDINKFRYDSPRAAAEAVCQIDNIIHTPGYLTIHCQQDEQIGTTLVLQWLPNSTLHKNPSSIRSVSPRSQVRQTTRHCPSSARTQVRA
ncbi:hypothetical protein ANCCAN_17258 [Ancylostoma caninum]|uniref:Uncharacterized protein n=1 Tax=Ancylostoma caninum TaxID=29170 RepID=A0A368FXC8_ANCCA|nr:hypothetical protein ANCCAN_17258 [Ancylostoma caninum]